MPAKIKYRGEEIASVAGGQTATIKCADKAMNDDIEVEVEPANDIVNITIKEI